MQEEPASIIKDKELSESMDYQLLRKEAIALTQQISGDKWTDYNIHDPGVTILEQFCYALTDIAYRTNLNIETLLFHEGDREKIIRTNALFPAEEIFPSGPLTQDDYRILILDKFPNKISNCWVKKITDHREGIQGLFQVTLLLKSDVLSSEYAEIKNQVHAFFCENRNLCEDIESIVVLEPERICLSANIDIYQDENAEEILVEILFQIEHYFNHSVHFSTLDELTKSGLSLDETFDIPSHTHGFITQKELMPKQQEFYVSKIADYILDVKGVRNLRDLNVTQGNVPVNGDIIEVSADKYLTLGILGDHNAESPFEGFNISLFKGGIINSYVKDVVIYSLEIKEAKTHRSFEIRTKTNLSKEKEVKTKELVSYESIQKSFPGIFGIGDYTPVKEDGEVRKAQSAQLKAYLMFFDQIMSNHLAQLSKISELFATQEIDLDSFRTYFSQLLSSGTSGAKDLIQKKIPKKSVLLDKLNKRKLWKTKLSDQESKELENIGQDLAEKELIVKLLVAKEFENLAKLPAAKLKKSQSFENREIIQLMLDFQKLEAKLNDKKKNASENDESIKKNISEKQEKKQIKLQNRIEELMVEELMEKEQFVDFQQRDLDSLLIHFDSSGERKNRLLTHILARFGERFTTDFHIKFNSLMEGESQEIIDKKLISLKSSFIKEIINLNRFRSKGLNYRSKETWQATEIPLKRKVTLLLNIEHNPGEKLASTHVKNKLKATKLTGSDIVKEKSQVGNLKYMKPAQDKNKITFLVNSSSVYRYLFKYGLKETNYRIVKEQGNYVIYFTPPTDEDSTRLLEVKTKEDAHKKVETLIQFLKNINAQNEGFHIVEHILLRPMDSNECYFLISGRSNKKIFKSSEHQQEDLQKKNALDTLLLAGYSNNYKVLQNPDKEYIVYIKNTVGKEMANSIETFTTEISAQSFVDECSRFFKTQKESEDFEKLFELDNQKKYYFDLLFENNEVFFRSVNAFEIKEQENNAENAGILGMNPDNYKSEGNADDTFSVFLINYDNKKIAKSKENFGSKEAEEFILKSVSYFEKLNETKSYDLIIRYQREDGRSADEFNSQLSIVYSDWTARFHNKEFLQLFEQTFFNCAPAHLAINIVGLNYSEMKAFEKVYFQYMEEIGKSTFEDRAILSKLSNNLMDILIDKDS